MFSATRTSREVGTLQVGHGRYLIRRVGGGRVLWMDVALILLRLAMFLSLGPMAFCSSLDANDKVKLHC